MGTSRLLPDAHVESAIRSATRRGGLVLGWAVIVASPIVMVGALLLFRPPPAPPPTTTSAQAESTPAGWAEMYVRSWLSASRDDTVGMETFYPAGMRSQRSVGTQVPVDTATLSVTSPAAGRWSVLVVVNLLTQQPTGEHLAKLTCHQVSLLESPDGAYVAPILPSPVACPATLPAADLDYPETAEVSGPVGQSVLGFLTSYLAGRDGLDRYLAPGSRLVSVVPAPYVTVELTELRTHQSFEPGQAARPLDGQQIQVLARAAGYDATSQMTAVDYALTLTARSGRWEVSSLDPIPLLTGSR